MKATVIRQNVSFFLLIKKSIAFIFNLDYNSTIKDKLQVDIIMLKRSPVKTLPYLFTDMDIETYHSCGGISRSSLMSFKRSPMHYWHEHLNPEYIKPEPSAQMLLGNVVHTMLLEPGELWARYFSFPRFDRRTTKGKAAYEEYRRKAGDKIILLQDMEAQAIAMGGCFG